MCFSFSTYRHMCALAPQLYNIRCVVVVGIGRKTYRSIVVFVFKFFVNSPEKLKETREKINENIVQQNRCKILMNVVWEPKQLKFSKIN